MKTFHFLLILIFPFCLSCKSSISINKIFSKETPHEAYADKIGDLPGGQQWITASSDVLTTPALIVLPYRHTGFFPAGRPRALALQFAAKRGERITFDLARKTGDHFVIYADVFKQDGSSVSHLLAADTASGQFSFDAEQTGNYILRLQPALNSFGGYSLAASISPSLGFPVAGTKAKTGSFWGDARDGGLRRHEGIDIFAPKRTPAVAAADGFITRVSEGGIGGKTIWMRAEGTAISLYYAHLDKQLVEAGQLVKKGDTLGLIGNTGNAKYTLPHLHFGIYGFGGAVDPWPFVNKMVKTAPLLKMKDIPELLTFKKKSSTDTLQKPGVPLIPLAVTDNGYIAELPGGRIIQTPFTAVKQIKNENQVMTTASSSAFLGKAG